MRSRTCRPWLTWLILAPAGLLGEGPPAAPEPVLRLVTQHEHPLITVRHPDAAGIKYGFEGGRVVKIGSSYHLFTSEMAADPIWVKMKFGYWRSGDGLRWTRVATIFESSGEFEGRDPRAALWSPLPVFDDAANRWNLFYVAYRSAPGTGGQFMLNHKGEIWRSVSEKPGRDGIGGPYKDVGVMMHPGPDSDPWEGLQGTDSFFPYRVGQRWYALYGSARTETVPISYWLVGMASAPALGGPWKRRSSLNPSKIEKTFIENPIVELLPQGGYLCVYDNNVADAIGYAFSADGIHWNPGKSLVIQPKPKTWAKDVRTPLGLVAEGGGEYSIYYTGFEQEPDWPALLAAKPGKSSCAIGLVKVRLQ
ncbi:MAG: hypothetical protein FJW34_12655 [Acidobacteria bacterium]|nr:hypothetical protein [Acidobacteriota bacterium]